MPGASLIPLISLTKRHPLVLFVLSVEISPTLNVCPPYVYSKATAKLSSGCKAVEREIYPKASLSEYSEGLSRRALPIFS